MLADARARAVDLGFAAGWGVVKAAPHGMAAGGFRRAADRAARRDGPAVRQLRANLRRVVGPGVTEIELEDLTRRGLRSYARYWLETFRLPRMDKRIIAETTDANMTGQEHIVAGLEKGNGVVVALPHQGNWDIAGVWLVGRHGPFATVAERLKPESLFDRFLAYRESLGFEVVPLTGGERAPLDVLTESLRQNKVVCLLADRDLSRSGIEVDFFGERARMPGGPALLAATTGAPLLVASCWFTADGGWGQAISPPITVPEGRLRDVVPTVTQAMATGFEAGLAARPEDWHMLQKLWLADLPPRAPGSPKPG